MNKPSERLKLARQAAGYVTAKNFAEANNIKYSTYRCHENGENAISQATAEHYAALLKIEPEWLLFGKESQPDFLDKLIRKTVNDSDMAYKERKRKIQLLFIQVMETIFKTLNIETSRSGVPVTLNIESLVKETDSIVDELMQKIDHEEEQEAAILRCVGVMQAVLEKKIIIK
jgi:transcriptional regulator with XRE-family HTH domain